MTSPRGTQDGDKSEEFEDIPSEKEQESSDDDPTAALEQLSRLKIGFDDPEDPNNLTPRDIRSIHRNAQATSVVLSSLSAEEYNKVIGLEIAKEIWDTLHIAHEGVSKVKKSKIDLLMAQLNRFVIKKGEEPQEMFDRLMVIVGKIRGLGGDDLEDHHVVKVMLEAFAPRNPTLVTLIREKKRFEQFSPSDVLGRILTHELMEMEIQQRKKFGELETKMENLKVKEVALKANKSSKASTSSVSRPASSKVKVDVSSSDSSDDEDDSGSSGEIGDVALFMRKYKKVLKREGYMFTKRKFTNKKKRTCYKCGSTEHLIAECPLNNEEEKRHKKKSYKREDKNRNKKKQSYSGQAHIGHEWDSHDESSSEEEGKKIATIAIKNKSSSPRLFTNLTDDEDNTTPFCLMAKGEKVKQSKLETKSTPPPSDLSDIDSSDESSDDEINNLVSKMDKKSRNFIAKLVEELEKTQAILVKQEKLYITCKENLASERSEVEALRLELDQAETIQATLKDNLNALQEKNNALKNRNEELEEQYSILWDSTKHLPKASEISSASTSKGCDRCYKFDINAYATNLANMEAMKKEIARLNNIIASGCMDDASKKAKKKETIGEVQSVQTMKAPGRGGSGKKPGGSGVWKENRVKAQSQPKQQASKASNTRLQVKENPIVPKRNKYVHKSKTHASQESTSTSYVLRRNNLGKVVATYVGNQSNIYVKRSL
ncbi:uncharacterized protein LOC112898224 [Panicum hallii]|uniref:uncharacterized protein LOC112898224 n=1 Tax=Panicum hallii TaxID=206008 RepID=UPI000DF4E72F|nr:uncharacterized protein LOC112898224 [Panicum hallii]